MSLERKTAEIKFRVEPSVKAFWRAQAADETDGNLSELITKATNQHVHWAKENARLDGTKLLGNAIDAITEVDPVESQFATVLSPGVPEGDLWVVDMDKVSLERPAPAAIIKHITDASPQEDVPTSDEVGAKCDCGQVHTTHFDFGASNEGHSVACPANPALTRKQDWTFEGRNA